MKRITLTLAVILNLTILASSAFILGEYKGANAPRSTVDQESVDRAVMQALVYAYAENG
jgi:hypothetical protein